MTYRVNRAAGFQPWGVTNPWVYANYGQPQRGRGYVSPMVFQTLGPYLKTAHLGEAVVNAEASAAEQELLRHAAADRRRGERMERYALTGLAISVTSLFIAYSFHSRRARPVSPNRRRARRRTSRRRG
jgi:hypothetical protein